MLQLTLESPLGREMRFSCQEQFFRVVGFFLFFLTASQAAPPPPQVWFQNCRARHKKHVSPGHASAAPVSSLPARLSPPLMDELHFSTFGPADGPMLTALHSYVDGKSAPT